MKNTWFKVFLCFFVLFLAILVGVCVAKFYAPRQLQGVQTTPSPDRTGFIWGATVRPFALADRAHPYKSSDLEQQFQFVSDLFGKNGCVRTNIEQDMAVNDELVNFKKKYGLCLYLILEDDLDFNSNLNFEQKATDLAAKIVSRYRGNVEYYQLANELTGTMVDLSGNKNSLDAGYGLKIDKTRYNNVLRYTKTLSSEVRRLDPDAKIVISGHWILIDPILDLVKDGVKTDIIGWNWGSGLGENPGAVDVDGYGQIDIPQIVKDAGLDFWIVEANYDDGSTGGKENAQAQYISSIAQKAYNSSNISGYFHFILTDTNEEPPISQLGLIKVRKSADGSWSFGLKKPAYQVLKSLASSPS